MAVLNEHFDYEDIREYLDGQLNKFSSPVHLRIQSEKLRNLNAFMIAAEFQRRGHFVVWEKKSRFEVIDLEPRLSFSFSHLRGYSRGAISLLRDKAVFKRALSESGISVATGVAVPTHDKEGGRQFVAKSQTACVIKPACGHKGKGVTVGVKSDDQFDYAWDLAVKENRDESDILIEDQFSGGVEARFLVVGGKCVSVCRRIPPIVVGDGVKTVDELIEEKNAEKRKSPGQVIRQIKLDEHRVGLIKAQGFSLDDVPERGTYVLIDHKAGASTGADTLEISDLVHPDYLRIAEHVSRVAKNIPVLGVDIISKSFSGVPTRESYIVLEGNIAPGLSGHCYPSYGNPKNIVSPIVDHALSLSRSKSLRSLPACNLVERPLSQGAFTSFSEACEEWLDGSVDMTDKSMSFKLGHDVRCSELAKRVYEHNRSGESLVFFEKPPVTTKALTVTFCGDTSLGYYYLEKSKRKYAEAYERLQDNPISFFDGVRPLIDGSDEVIVNLETVLSHAPGAPIEGKEYPGCDDPDVTIEVLKELGVTAVTLANNHTMDYGPDKMLAMIEKLKSHGIAVIGAGRNLEEARKPYHIQMNAEDGVKNLYIFNGMRSTRRYMGYGFFAKKDKPGIASTSFKAMSREIQKVKSADPDGIIIVCPHWQGIDYQDTSEKHREWSRAIIDAGADHVVAHGSHKADAVETYRGGKIFHSIGNFVFNSPGRYKAKQAEPYSFVVSLTVDEMLRSSIRSEKICTDNKRTGFKTYVVDEVDRSNEAPEKEKSFSGMDYCLQKMRNGNALVVVDDNWSKGRRVHSGQHGKDDHEIIEKAKRSNVREIIASREFDGEGIPVKYVENTLQYFLDAGKSARRKFKGKVLAVTGSAGKSSTVLMLSHVLRSMGFSVLSTDSNHNTIYGISALLSNLNDDYDFCVVEAALSGFYRYENHVGKLISPDVSIITSIDVSQPELIESSEKTAYYKSKIYEGLGKEGGAVYCNNTKHSQHLAFMANAFSNNPVSYGDDDSTVSLKHFDVNAGGSGKVLCSIDDEIIEYTIPTPSRAMAYNSLAVLSACKALGLNLAEAATSLASSPKEKRVLDFYSGALFGKNIEFVDDTKNATINSVKEVLKVLSAKKVTGKKIFVLGRLVHLGEHERNIYSEIAALLDEFTPDLVIGLGDEVKPAMAGLDGLVFHGILQDTDELMGELSTLVEDGDLVAIKGSSRGTGIRKTADRVISEIR
ncbi:CapA family protein [Halomonas stenophila]|uniref:UDP-N-acetylmuramyl pentapeptide synthase/poly-gamma-glutamate capsule biosynthesis protein CapA/YwtB (Metallophosphatase superfamily)/D-alanine-D-alanine ligase-like ATP-grasp enzyme n=1 Tax=Halomonas stenophila TaxID=795312 RepID=A0A7W5ERX0_9GAMM|nr:CapA family protein [Halomonas stenophila]MBB3230166.1 UDP-N-acetylmuramyl pentapeptide synthase/poly-gamma-glutamate capsule biosynthesis protein CapA/YwtB (metallophosphatase superfamily)/D-alanine-D-alanine ligase-like ATP-grasp enzyme [Halomonas stenophila]